MPSAHRSLGEFTGGQPVETGRVSQPQAAWPGRELSRTCSQLVFIHGTIGEGEIDKLVCPSRMLGITPTGLGRDAPL